MEWTFDALNIGPGRKTVSALAFPDIRHAAS